jgi:hypothetical protein
VDGKDIEAAANATIQNTLSVSYLEDQTGSKGTVGQALLSGGATTTWAWGTVTGDASAWATFPATANVNMSAFNIDAAGTVTTQTIVPEYITDYSAGSRGTAGQVIVSGGPTTPWAWGAAADVSTWATFTATQNVDMGAFDITNVSAVFPQYIEDSTGSRGTVGQVLTAGAVDGDPLSWQTPTSGDVSTWATFPATTNVDINGANLNNVAVLQVQSIEAAAGGQGAALQILTAGDAGSTTEWKTLGSLINNFTYNFYVSSTSGSDTTGTGTISNPFQTIANALDIANTIPDTAQITIILAAGTYTETVFFNRANTFITGAAASLSTSTIINGVINIDLTSSTLPFVIGGISSVQITNIVYTNAVAANQSFLITDCLIAPGVGVSAMTLTDTSVGGTGDVTVQSCLIYMSDVVAINNSSVYMVFINTEIKNNPLISSPVSLIQTSGTGRITMYGCVLSQISSLSTVSPLINITNNAATGTMVISNSTLQYLSTTSDAGTGGKCCVRCANSAAITSISLFNNLLICQGATTTNGNAGQFVVLQRTGAGTVTVLHGQNSGGTTANHLPANGGGFTKTAYVNVA